MKSMKPFILRSCGKERQLKQSQAAAAVSEQTAAGATADAKEWSAAKINNKKIKVDQS